MFGSKRRHHERLLRKPARVAGLLLAFGLWYQGEQAALGRRASRAATGLVRADQNFVLHILPVGILCVADLYNLVSLLQSGLICRRTGTHQPTTAG